MYCLKIAFPSLDTLTFTDFFNCAIPNQLDSFYKLKSGISLVDQPIEVFALPGSTEIGLQFPAMQYVDNVHVPTQTFYEYYTINYADAQYVKVSNNRLLQ